MVKVAVVTAEIIEVAIVLVVLVLAVVVIAVMMAMALVAVVVGLVRDTSSKLLPLFLSVVIISFQYM